MPIGWPAARRAGGGVLHDRAPSGFPARRRSRCRPGSSLARGCASRPTSPRSAISCVKLVGPRTPAMTVELRTNVPRPCSRRRSPDSSRLRSAWRMVIRLTPSISLELVASLGICAPSPRPVGDQGPQGPFRLMPQRLGPARSGLTSGDFNRQDHERAPVRGCPRGEAASTDSRPPNSPARDRDASAVRGGTWRRSVATIIGASTSRLSARPPDTIIWGPAAQPRPRGPLRDADGSSGRVAPRLPPLAAAINAGPSGEALGGGIVEGGAGGVSLQPAMAIVAFVGRVRAGPAKGAGRAAPAAQYTSAREHRRTDPRADTTTG